MNGEIDVEQLWIDFKIVDQFNWRAPGIDLIPIGYINEHHEPTQFYSVLRPEIYNGLIPSTWMAPSSSVYGSIASRSAPSCTANGRRCHSTATPTRTWRPAGSPERR